MMRDVTYGTTFWKANPDIINRVLSKMTSISKSGWSMLSASEHRWTSSRFNQTSAYIYSGGSRGLLGTPFYNGGYNYFTMASVNLYEF